MSVFSDISCLVVLPSLENFILFYDDIGKVECYIVDKCDVGKRISSRLIGVSLPQIEKWQTWASPAQKIADFLRIATIKSFSTDL